MNIEKEIQALQKKIDHLVDTIYVAEDEIETLEELKEEKETLLNKE